MIAFPNLFQSQSWLRQEEVVSESSEGILAQLKQFELEQEERQEEDGFLQEQAEVSCSRVDPDYFARQADIQPYMRQQVLDWLMEVCDAYGLRRETFYLAGNYMDTYLTHVTTSKRQELQLIAITSLFISSKIEEIIPQSLDVLADTTCNSFTHEEIREMEIHMLKTIQFYLTPNTAMFWANAYLHQWDKVTQEQTQLQFRRNNQKSYHFYREFCQILDCCYLDHRSLHYQSRLLVLAIL